jgi:hypothetical protein
MDFMGTSSLSAGSEALPIFDIPQFERESRPVPASANNEFAGKAPPRESLRQISADRCRKDAALLRRSTISAMETVAQRATVAGAKLLSARTTDEASERLQKEAARLGERQ